MQSAKRVFLVAAMLLGSLSAASTAQAGAYEDLQRYAEEVETRTVLAYQLDPSHFNWERAGAAIWLRWYVDYLLPAGKTDVCYLRTQYAKIRDLQNPAPSNFLLELFIKQSAGNAVNLIDYHQGCP